MGRGIQAKNSLFDLGGNEKKRGGFFRSIDRQRGFILGKVIWKLNKLNVENSFCCCCCWVKGREWGYAFTNLNNKNFCF